MCLAFNFRLTALSPSRLQACRGTRNHHKYSPTGTMTRGTLNNCGTGKTPWGTFLTGEENWFGYFTRGAADDAARGNDKSVTSLKRYGRSQGAASRHGWETGGADDKYQRWNNSKTGASTNNSDDYRNEMNGMGYIVEIDAYDKTRMAKKRTALGRFAHESAAFGKAVVGQPLSIYMGDDSRGEYIYKFVTTAVWDAADANPNDRMAVGDKYLDSGKLYAAKFNADGTAPGWSWNDQYRVASYATYKFADAADIASTPAWLQMPWGHQDGPPRVERREPRQRRDLLHADQQQQPKHRPHGQPVPARRGQPARLHRHEGRQQAKRQPQRPPRAHEGSAASLQDVYLFTRSESRQVAGQHLRTDR
jgi:hypothetical protein